MYIKWSTEYGIFSNQQCVGISNVGEQMLTIKLNIVWLDIFIAEQDFA